MKKYNWLWVTSLSYFIGTSLFLWAVLDRIILTHIESVLAGVVIGLLYALGITYALLYFSEEKEKNASCHDKQGDKTTGGQ
jgi:hypothetical protein